MWANPGSEACAGKVNRQVRGGRVTLVCCLGGEGGGGMDSNAEDSVIKLPEKNVPLYSHSLPCIEAWLKTMDFFQSKDDRAIWLIERSDWHAQLSLDITDLYIRWVSTSSSICASTSIDFQPASQQELQCDAASGVMMMAVARDDVRQMHWEKEIVCVGCALRTELTKPPNFCKLNKNQRISNDESGKGWQQLML